MDKEEKKMGLADRLKEKHATLEAEYKTRRAKELEEGTGTAITIRQVGQIIGIIMFIVGVLGLLLIRC